MPRRNVSTTRSRSRRSAGGYGEPVYTWAFRSSQPRGGQYITYETRLEEDGKLRCNCPGWIFCKIEKDGRGNQVGDKTCKHTNMVKNEAPDILRRFRNGEQLPVFDEQFREVQVQPVVSGRISSNTPNLSNPPRAESEARPNQPDTALRRGRVIVLD